jgi:hypothetical protein
MTPLHRLRRPPLLGPAHRDRQFQKHCLFPRLPPQSPPGNRAILLAARRLLPWPKRLSLTAPEPTLRGYPAHRNRKVQLESIGTVGQVCCAFFPVGVIMMYNRHWGHCAWLVHADNMRTTASSNGRRTIRG